MQHIRKYLDATNQDFSAELQILYHHVIFQTELEKSNSVVAAFTTIDKHALEVALLRYRGVELSVKENKVKLENDEHEEIKEKDMETRKKSRRNAPPAGDLGEMLHASLSLMDHMNTLLCRSLQTFFTSRSGRQET